MEGVGDKDNSKVLFLMLDFEDQPWISLFEDGCQGTWMNQNDIRVLRYRGRKSVSNLNKKLNRLQVSRTGVALARTSHIAYQLSKKRLKVTNEENSILNVDLPDNWWRHGQKFLSALRYCLENYEFDYLVRGNASLYVNGEQLQQFLAAKKPVYAGPIEKNKPFASGWGVILHKEACNLLLNLDYSPFAKFFDDQAIGYALSKSHILPAEVPYLWIKSLDEVKAIEVDTLKTYPFIRTKSFSSTGNRNDAAVMMSIHQKIEFDKFSRESRHKK